ncbi:MAG: hypothetical protein KC435_09995 [Thermomicrobiales bacterium]|nr:hypothetical protein [Thermomicrobiales bacterium]
MRYLGKIVRLQVQVDSIKTGERPHQIYTPVPNLTSVPVLRLTADGVEGIDQSGTILPDVHNRTHPHSKFRGDNGVSICFTEHYRRMRDRYGDHLTNGIAGENMLIDHDITVSYEEIAHGVVIRGDDREITIGPWDIAHPCAPFSKFCLRMTPDEKPDKRITETLQFLENGTRGFVAVYDDEAGVAEICVGDEVWLVG